MARRSQALLLSVAAALVLAGSAAALPPLPVGQPMGSPIALPLPKPGGAVFAKLVISGTLKPGVETPDITVVAIGPSTGTIRVVDAQSKPVTVHGKTTITVYFAIGDISKTRRLAEASGQTEVDVFGVADQWTNIQIGHIIQWNNCGEIKAAVKVYAHRVIFGQPGDQWAAMWLEAYQRAHWIKCPHSH